MSMGVPRGCQREWGTLKGNNHREARVGCYGNILWDVRRWDWGIPKGEMRGSQGGHGGVLS